MSDAAIPGNVTETPPPATVPATTSPVEVAAAKTPDAPPPPSEVERGGTDRPAGNAGSADGKEEGVGAPQEAAPAVAAAVDTLADGPDVAALVATVEALQAQVEALKAQTGEKAGQVEALTEKADKLAQALRDERRTAMLDRFGVPADRRDLVPSDVDATTREGAEKLAAWLRERPFLYDTSAPAVVPAPPSEAQKRLAAQEAERQSRAKRFGLTSWITGGRN